MKNLDQALLVVKYDRPVKQKQTTKHVDDKIQRNLCESYNHC